MTEREAEYKMREAAYGFSAESDWRKAVDLLRKIAHEIEQGNDGSRS